MLHEIVLATGCTEPVAVALAATKSRETLGEMPDSIEIFLSKNVFKNAMGVGIPGTGMIGLPIAVAMGITEGASDRNLEVLNILPRQVENAKLWLEQNSGRINIHVKDTTEKLYIECVCRKGSDSATAVIAQRHTNFVRIERNGHVLLENSQTEADTQTDNAGDGIQLSARKVFEFATMAPLEELEFINETVKYDMAVSDAGLSGNYGLTAGKVLMEQADGDIVHTTVSKTVAASDARMAGCSNPVFSNSGSGNQGITCTIPVYEFGTLNKYPHETITRGLIMSHLMSIYIKRGIGRLSALCGIVNASLGVTSGLTYMQGGSYEQVTFALKNLINTLTGMVCDGAKPSCALKVATGVYSAFVASKLAMHTKVVDETDGLSEQDIDRTISNLGKLGKDAMNETDEMILEIMTNKQHREKDK